ncbi:hypothetical protein Tco_1072815 [Tanacetum coccineum]
MAKQVELNKKKGKGTSQGENRPVRNNVQSLNHQNKFVLTAVLTRTGRIPVNTARHNFNSQAVSTSTARKVNTARPIVNEIRPRNNFYKSHSPITRPFNRTTTPRTKFSNQKVNTIGDKVVSVVGGKRETADNPQRALKNKGIVDSGCSRHMTGNKAYLAEYQDYNGGPVAFGGSCVGFNHHTTNGHQFTMSNRHQELASLEQTTSALAILGQTATGKESSNPLMADSLPKTIQSNDPPLSRGYTLRSEDDSLKLMELMAYCTNLCEFVSKKNREIK